MSKYNAATKNANFTIKGIERDDYRDQSIWTIATTSPISIEAGGLCRILPAGSVFKYTDAYEADEDEVLDCILARGILDACNISDGAFEQMLEEG